MEDYTDAQLTKYANLPDIALPLACELATSEHCKTAILDWTLANYAIVKQNVSGAMKAQFLPHTESGDTYGTLPPYLEALNRSMNKYVTSERGQRRIQLIYRIIRRVVESEQR